MRKVILLRYLPMRLKTFVSLVLLSILLISGNPLLANSSDDEDNPVIERQVHNDLQRGERFFKGLLPSDRKFQACVSCHILSKPDTMNWNPSAMDIATKFAGKDFAEFQSAVMEPNGKKIEASHRDFKIEEVDLKKVKLYLDELAVTGPPSEGPTVNQLALFVLLVILMILALHNSMAGIPADLLYSAV